MIAVADVNYPKAWFVTYWFLIPGRHQEHNGWLSALHYHRKGLVSLEGFLFQSPEPLHQTKFGRGSMVRFAQAETPVKAVRACRRHEEEHLLVGKDHSPTILDLGGNLSPWEFYHTTHHRQPDVLERII